jgi:hypothetical protein
MLTVIENYSKDTIIKQYHDNSWNWTIIYSSNLTITDSYKHSHISKGHLINHTIPNSY